MIKKFVMITLVENIHIPLKSKKLLKPALVHSYLMLSKTMYKGGINFNLCY